MFNLKVNIYDNIEHRVIKMISGYEITHSHDSECSVGDLIHVYTDNDVENQREWFCIMSCSI